LLTDIHTQTQPTKPIVFLMEFHLPFYAWRRHVVLREDTRKKANGEPLRKSRALAFLVSKDPDGLDDRDCVYESCVSCTVTGYNDFVWTACLAVDTYFSDVNETKDKVSDYSDEDVILSDPLLAAHNRYIHDPTRPILDPRVYFLAVFSAWIKRVENEWGNVIFRLRRGIEKFVSSHDSPVPKSTPYGMHDLTRARPKRPKNFSVYKTTTDFRRLCRRAIIARMRRKSSS
jgi:hypothetical protein